ncbi:alpha/beta fold hydrolase [Luteimonas terrae]|uniref:Pimeloyl-ACP methyl ester carboxylesterase n=1 Tax=Luteimonas terrae TaxID=1530191 RepID=A0ABU1XT93_9GAMM|nr:alpha/beta fold hydrolase [Luteimonas terrae]MDR7191788.1 pimeloyl-ACP methyl ester carboxylesterase [Luteimonas terrae]
MDSECLTAALPLRHEAPADGSIEVFVRRVPAASPETRRGEVWLIAGGPGEPGASFHPLLATFRAAFPDHDLIVPDHRGTGRSTRLCPEQESPESAEGVALAGEEWGPCIGSLHANAARTAAFNITEAAQDLSTLIARHRRDGEVRLYAVSYGTQLALRMLQVAPQPLDGLVLDGLVPPESAAQWDLGHRTAVVDAVGRELLGPDDVVTYRTLLATDADAPWRAHVPGGDLRRTLGMLLNFPSLRARIPQIVDALVRDDAAPLQTALDDLQAIHTTLTTDPFSPPSLPLVMLISASENNDRRDLDPTTVEAEARDALFTSPIPGFLVDTPLPLYPRDRFFGGLPAAIPPTLVVHGTLDPNTPYAGALAHVDALRTIGPVQLSTVDAGAHLLAFVAPDCFAGATRAFVAGEEAPVRCREADTQ